MSLFSRISNPRGPNNNNPGNRPVCQFYLEGRCRYGDSCRNYHPPQSSNSSQSRNAQQLPYQLNAETIKLDLTTGNEKPSWPLSAYGPGREAPRQLLEGALEQSQEELRVQYYLAKASGDPGQYEQNENAAQSEASSQVQRILNDLDGAIKFVIDGKDAHPNREDMVQKTASNFPWKERPSTGVPSASGGQSSSFGGAGGASAFGQVSSQPTSTFGQPSAFGSQAQQTGGSAFGQASSLGSQTSAFGATPSAFGASSALGSGGSAFGRPSPLGGGGGSAFGQPSSLGGSSPFGGAQSNSNAQGSAFGQTSSLGSGGSAFGKPSPFGAAAAPSTAPAFGQSSPFGQGASQTATTTSAFGQPSPPGPQQSTFGQPSGVGQQASVFGQSSTPSSQQSAFGKPSPFGNAAGSGGSAFGQASQPNSQPSFGNASTFRASNSNSPFGQTSQPGQTQASPFGNTTSSTPFGGAATNNTASPFAQPPSSLSATTSAPRQPGEPLTSWNGQPVIAENNPRTYFYRNQQTNKKERIWFPDGPPGPNADAEAMPPSLYDDAALGAALKQAYEYVRDHGVFKDGVVPEIPPKREWIRWEI